MRAALATVGFLLLLAGHLDFWRPRSAEIVLGWIPVELAWRLAWMLAAWLYLMAFTRFVWRDEE